MIRLSVHHVGEVVSIRWIVLNISPTLFCVIWLLWDGMGPYVPSKYRLTPPRTLHHQGSWRCMRTIVIIIGGIRHTSSRISATAFIYAFAKSGEFLLKRRSFRLDFFHTTLIYWYGRRGYNTEGCRGVWSAMNGIFSRIAGRYIPSAHRVMNST